MNNNIIQLSSYTSPVVVETNREAWVEYGSENNHYQFLIDRYSNSATNNAVINNICRLIYGKGLTATNASIKPNDYAQFLSIIDGEDLKRVIFDLYMLGQCALQVHYDKSHKSILRAYHTPIQLLRPEKCNKHGEIEAYYYSDNWSDPRKFVPQRIDYFGTSKKEIEILCYAPYTAGMKYFSAVDYQGGIDYALLEEKIAEYLINEVTNSFAPTTIVNFNNGTPTDEQKDEISNSVIQKLTGSTGKKIVISFNENESTKTTIDSVPLNDAPDHYQYLSDECTAKILRAHNVTTPLLFGVSSATGFSSNADEMKTGSVLFDNMVIKPKQEAVINMIKKIMLFNGINLSLKFKSLQPFTDGDEEVKPVVEMSKQDELDVAKYGEDIDLGEWVLIDSHEVDYDLEEGLDKQIKDLNTPTTLSKIVKFVSQGTAIPNSKSKQDGEIFKHRYRYVGEITDKSRLFCRKMIQANKVYRKEDIIKMNSQIVNETSTRQDGSIGGFGPRGATTYDIFLYKGGGACHHKWVRETYLRKSDVNNPLAKKFTPAQTRKAGEVAPTNDKRVYTRPIDMPNKGFLPK